MSPQQERGEELGSVELASTTSDHEVQDQVEEGLLSGQASSSDQREEDMATEKNRSASVAVPASPKRAPPPIG